jgi:4-amino-4-deoxy-L-arabinose transferase
MAASPRHFGGTRGKLLFILLAAACIRLYAASEPSLHAWDERYHAVVAKHLLDHPLTPMLYDPPVLPSDERDWHVNGVWLHKPPLALWLMAASLRLFGISELALRLPSVALSTLSVALTFLIGRRLFDERTGLLAAAFHTVNGLLVALASGRAPSDHVDTALVTFVELGVLLALQATDRPAPLLDLALGAVVGAAVLTKWYPGLLALPLWVFLFLCRRPQPAGILASLARILAAAAALVLPWTLHLLRVYPQLAFWEWHDAWAHLSETLAPPRGGAWFYLASMPKFFGELVYLPVAWLAIAAFQRRSPPLQLLLLWIAIPYAVFSLAVTKMPAYVMIAAPAVFLAEAWFWWELRDRTPEATGRVWRGGLLLVLAVLPARYLLRPGGPFTLDHRRPAWAERLIALREQLPPQRVVLFGVPQPIEAMFYLPCIAYDTQPTAGQAESLLRRGYAVLVYDAETGGLARRVGSLDPRPPTK